MWKFLAGCICGLLAGFAMAARAADIDGGNGYLPNWSVMKDGKVICESPFVWVQPKEIEWEKSK
jgi:hypothetical protein